MIRAQPAERRSAWIPWLFVAFAVVVLTANGILIWLANRTWPGLVTERPYDYGLTYNRNLAAAERQAALGWEGRLSARLTRGFEGEATFELRGADGGPLGGAEVTAAFERPSQTALDFTVPLAEDGAGSYRAGFTLPAAGLWAIHVTARRGEDLFVLRERLVLR